MISTPLFPMPEGLEITDITEIDNAVHIHLISHRLISVCPTCSTPSSHIHSHYRRHPRDLPCSGRAIHLVLTVKKFFCRQAACLQNIFVERLPDIIVVSSRLTNRLRTAIQEIGFSSTGKGGERLSAQLGMSMSDATILRSLFLRPLLTPSHHLEVIGIDDWSYRRGRRFGSIIIDLPTHTVVDLLPERSTESVIQWLLELLKVNYSGTTMITRIGHRPLSSSFKEQNQAGKRPDGSTRKPASWTLSQEIRKRSTSMTTIIIPPPSVRSWTGQGMPPSLDKARHHRDAAFYRVVSPRHQGHLVLRLFGAIAGNPR